MSTNITLRRRALHYGTGDGFDLTLGSVAPRAAYTEIPTFGICAPSQPFSVNNGDVIIFTRNLYTGTAGGIGYGPIVAYKSNFSYVDYYGLSGSQVDTEGRNVRQVTIDGTKAFVNFVIDMRYIDDTYVYNVTQGKYLFRGNNIPSDYIPQLGGVVKHLYFNNLCRHYGERMAA